MSIWPTIFGYASPLIVAVGAGAGVVFSRRTGAEANHTADWDKFTARMESWTARELSALTDRINDLADTVEDVRKERDLIRNDRDDLRHKYDVAVAYLRWLTRELQRVLPDADIRPPPQIADDL